MPSFLISANIFVCERLLQEGDGVTTAIRLVDVFYIGSERPLGVPPEALPLIQGWGFAILKFVPSHNQEHVFEMKLINTIGELSNLAEPMKQLVEPTPGLENLPTGATLNIQLNVAVKRIGTCYLCVWIDGEEVARTPFSVVPKSGVQVPFVVPPQKE